MFAIDVRQLPLEQVGADQEAIWRMRGSRRQPVPDLHGVERPVQFLATGAAKDRNTDPVTVFQRVVAFDIDPVEGVDAGQREHELGFQAQHARRTQHELQRAPVFGPACL